MPFDIVLFAIIAAFLVFRLRSVLGTRNGEEQKPENPFMEKPQKPSVDDDRYSSAFSDDDAEKVVSINPDNPEFAESSGEAGKIRKGLVEIATADTSFVLREFMKGSKVAFEYIVMAYAKGDLETLKPLLSQSLYANFEKGVQTRIDDEQTMEMELHRIKSAEIIDARLSGSMAYITVEFAVEETKVIRDKDGELVDGDPDMISEVTDIWTLARDIREGNPNWTLTETRTKDK